MTQPTPTRRKLAPLKPSQLPKLPKSKESTTMAKSTFDAPRGNMHKFLPEDIYIAGLDTKDGATHVLYDVTARNSKADEKLARNIARYGLLEPIVVNKDGERPVVIEGRRRVLAGRLLNTWIKDCDPRACGLDEPVMFDVVTKKGDDAKLMGMVVSANEMRVEQTPMTKARQALKMVEQCGASEEDVAIAFGVSSQAVANWLKLVDLAGPVQKAVDEGRIAASAAIELAPLPKSEQTAKLDDLVVAAGTNGTKVTGKTVRQAARGDESMAPKKREIRKAYEAIEELGEIDPKLLLGWVLGEVDAKRIKGLSKVLRGEDA